MKIKYNILILAIISTTFLFCGKRADTNTNASLNVTKDTVQKKDSVEKVIEADTLEYESLERVARITKNVVNPKSVIISPDGRNAYVNDLEGMNTMILSTENFEVVSNIKHTGKPVEFGITGGGRYIWISYFRLLEKGYPKELGDERSYKYNSVVVVYDTLEKGFVNRFEVGIIPKVIAVSPDEKLILVANWRSASVSVINTDSNEVIKTIKVGAVPRGIKFTHDGKYAYVCNFGGSTISKINIENLEVEKTITNVGFKPRDIVIRKDMKYAYFSNFGDGMLRKMDLETDKVVDKVKIGTEPRSICITNNDKYVFATNYQSGTVSVIDTETFEVIDEVRADVGAVGVALTPDMKYLWVTNQKSASIIVYKINYK